MMYVNQNPIKAMTLNFLVSIGPPSSERPQAILFLLIQSNNIVAKASPVNNITLKPRLPPSTLNLPSTPF